MPCIAFGVAFIAAFVTSQMVRGNISPWFLLVIPVGLGLWEIWARLAARNISTRQPVPPTYCPARRERQRVTY